MAVASKLLAQNTSETYQPLDARKMLHIGVVGGGFGSAFPWHKDPNCVVTAVAELRDNRRLRPTFPIVWTS